MDSQALRAGIAIGLGFEHEPRGVDHAEFGELVDASREARLALLIALGEVLVLAPGSVLGELPIEEPTGDVPLNPSDEDLLDEEFVERVGFIVLEVLPHDFDLGFNLSDGLVDVAGRGYVLPFLVCGAEGSEAAKSFKRNASDVVSKLSEVVESGD